MTSKLASTIIFFAAGVMLTCGPDSHLFETLEKDCESYCRNILNDCVPPDDRVTSPGLMDRCEDSCGDDADESFEQGEDCAQGYESLLSCVAGLTCDELVEWSRSDTGNRCESQTLFFIRECSDLWVAP